MISFEILFGLEELFEIIISPRDFFRVQGSIILLMPFFGLHAAVIFKILIAFGFGQFLEVILVV